MPTCRCRYLYIRSRLLNLRLQRGNLSIQQLLLGILHLLGEFDQQLLLLRQVGFGAERRQQVLGDVRRGAGNVRGVQLSHVLQQGVELAGFYEMS